MRRLNLRAGRDSDSYYQNIPLHGSVPAQESQFRVVSDQDVIMLKLWRDYILYNAGAQTFIPTPLPLVVAGYGILAPEFDYNDYQNLDVRNQIVVFMSGEPFSDDNAYFAGRQPTIYSDPVMKHRIALSRGARGSIMIPLPREKTYTDWSYWVRQFIFEDVKLMYGVSDNLNILLNFYKAKMLFQRAEYQLDDVLQFDSTGTMRSFSFTRTILCEV